MRDGLLLGGWARTGRLTGIITRLDADEVTIFEPGERTSATVRRGEVTAIPAGAVTVTVSVDLPLPHGVGEDSLRRWVAALTDPVLRERAAAALKDAGQDQAPALPNVNVVLTPADTSEAVCLCGATTPTRGANIECAACGRQAVAAP